MAEQVLTDISVLRTSPLAHLASALEQGSVQGERGVSLREIAFTTQLGLRAEPGTEAHAALAAATGVGLPDSVGQVAGTADGTAVLWSGPDEFLLVAPEGTELLDDLVQALGQAPGQVVDLSANRTVIELSGPSAREVLEKGCPADLHPRSFGAGTAITTVLGPVPVLLWKSAEDTFRLLPRASFADYTARWLLDAMTEYASPEVD
ncbi:sarcosine oxidase subunit gamma family protein [Paeniglutamicibacter gangotriensis]|uniref:Sarcosine oxidase subunit gamma family protein n=1 Tax=Paeniglutamicibacter gangotriensis TaxID=254787 RepID=A0A5B0EEH8_9MICC|nr:sarcosine oxidase subunit gamma family protein [Paeniglutamicibacter gangotriensis]KAA0977088.1 sarcosine oxidase subunit gamma family protein [Paeniglutamicibacter gangotriensis]